jgi:hypothetical protein
MPTESGEPLVANPINQPKITELGLGSTNFFILEYLRSAAGLQPINKEKLASNLPLVESNSLLLHSETNLSDIEIMLNKPFFENIKILASKLFEVLKSGGKSGFRSNLGRLNMYIKESKIHLSFKETTHTTQP